MNPAKAGSIVAEYHFHLQCRPYSEGFAQHMMRVLEKGEAFVGEVELSVVGSN